MRNGFASPARCSLLAMVQCSSMAGTASTVSLDHVTLGIAACESVALAGRSGAGKTTILRLLNGLSTPSFGRVLIDGAAMNGADLAERRRRIGTILQAPALF